MKVGIIGSGGREHAICEAIKQSNKTSEIYCIPGNAGTNSIAKNIELNIEDFDELKNFVKKNEIDIVIVGPEKPLVDGIVDFFEKNNIKPIDSLNKKLDPNFHQAMMEIEDDTKEPGTIIQEIQKGFTIKDRLLRPSLVGVSKKVTTKEEKTEENQENLENK